MTRRLANNDPSQFREVPGNADALQRPRQGAGRRDPDKGFLYLSQPGSFTGGYTGGLYIEDAGCGEYRLQLDEDVEVTSDLEGLERRLYDFAVGSGYIEADRFAEAFDKLVSATIAVLEQWDEDRVPAKAYPDYLPSLDVLSPI
jgi:hypothetical protein